jgi:queuine tRNA-ribosyltransferase
MNHLFKGKEMLGATLATIHNEYFIVRLVAQIREAIISGDFFEMKKEFMGRFYGVKI